MTLEEMIRDLVRPGCRPSLPMAQEAAQRVETSVPKHPRQLVPLLTLP